MKSAKEFKEFLEKMKRGPQNVVGIDLDSRETRVARLHKSNDQMVLTAAEIFPRTDLPEQQADQPPTPVPVLSLPQKFKAKYAALAVPGDNAVIKLLTFPGQLDVETEQKIVQGLGLTEPDKHRISYKLVFESHGRGESKFLAVALPESQAGIVPKLFPFGAPAPFSLEISSLAVMTTFLNSSSVNQKKDTALALLDFGANTTTFSIFNKRVLALIRRFPTGSNSIVAKVQESLGVDKETALSILADGAFDISQAINEVLEPLIKQLLISRDFVERRENCRVAALYVAGNFGTSKDMLEEMRTALGIELISWNPLEGLTIAPGAAPENLAGQEWRLAAAVGACLADLEES
ncbi:MAG: pilus assembly protein PilM [Verrucomicrobiota bacterium]|nr:pilus assembly protein PilM [Verrucomicrobiota bacterium]